MRRVGGEGGMSSCGVGGWLRGERWWVPAGMWPRRRPELAAAPDLGCGGGVGGYCFFGSSSPSACVCLSSFEHEIFGFSFFFLRLTSPFLAGVFFFLEISVPCALRVSGFKVFYFFAVSSASSSSNGRRFLSLAV